MSGFMTFGDWIKGIQDKSPIGLSVISKGGWDWAGEDKEYHRYRVKEPSLFQDKSFRTIEIKDGVKMVIGKLIGKSTMTTQNLMFDKSKFTKEQARTWIKKHPDAVKKSLDSMDYVDILLALNDESPFGLELDLCQDDLITKSDEEMIAYFVAMTPNLLDKQRDYITKNDIRDAASEFLQGSLDLDFEHIIPLSKSRDARVIASDFAQYDMLVVDNGVIPCYDYIKTVAEKHYGIEGLPTEVVMKSTHKKIVKDSWLFGLQVFNPVIWQDLKEGKILGVSPQGVAKRVPVQ